MADPRSISSLLLSAARDGEEARDGDDGDSLQKALAAAILSPSGPSKVPESHRLAVYMRLLFNTSCEEGPPFSTPDYFSEYKGSMQRTAATASLVQDVEMAVADVTLRDTTYLRSEVQGLIEHLCAKTSTPYSPTLLEIAAPLLQVALSAAEERTISNGDGTDNENDTKSPLAFSNTPTSPSTPISKEEKLRTSFALKRLFALLYRVLERFVPSRRLVKNEIELYFEIFRLLLQYHDPELSLHLDRQHVKLSDVLWNEKNGWTFNLFRSQSSSVQNTLALWDGLFALNDPVATPIVVVELLRTCRDELLGTQGKDGVTAIMQKLQVPQHFRIHQDLILATIQTLKRTPYATRELLSSVLFQKEQHQHSASANGVEKEGEEEASTHNALNVEQQLERLKQFVCLPITASELMDSFAAAQESSVAVVRKPHLKYIVLDCRAEKSFHFARLPTAMHVGTDIGFDPELLNRMAERLESARGSHICVLGTGRDMIEEANLLKIIALQLVSKGFRSIGIAEGGFRACIPHIKAGKIEVVRSAPSPSRDDGGDESERKTVRAAATASKQPHTATSATAEEHQTQQHWVSDETKEKLAHRAQEVKAKASEGLGVAKSWGLGFVSKVSAWRKGADGGESSSANAAHSTEKAQPAASHADPHGALPANHHQHQEGPSASDHEEHHQQQHQQQLFSFLDDDDEDTEGFSVVATVPRPSTASALTDDHPALASPAAQAPEAPTVTVISNEPKHEDKKETEGATNPVTTPTAAKDTTTTIDSSSREELDVVDTTAAAPRTENSESQEEPRRLPDVVPSSEKKETEEAEERKQQAEQQQQPAKDPTESSAAAASSKHVFDDLFV